MRTSSKFSITLPRDIKKWLEGRKSANCRSLSGEINYILREKMNHQIGEDVKAFSLMVSSKTETES